MGGCAGRASGRVQAAATRKGREGASTGMRQGCEFTVCGRQEQPKGGAEWRDDAAGGILDELTSVSACAQVASSANTSSLAHCAWGIVDPLPLGRTPRCTDRQRHRERISNDRPGGIRLRYRGPYQRTWISRECYYHHSSLRPVRCVGRDRERASGASEC